MKKRVNKKKKAFTLIELLAVILILGIISLIAVPLINDSIEESKVKAFETSIKNVINGVELNCQAEQINSKNITPSYVLENGISNPTLEIKGLNSLNGVINVDLECNVELHIYNNKYYAYKDYYGTIILGDLEDDNHEEITPNEEPVINNEGEYNLVYKLPNSTTFDGIDDYIDTGVMLFDELKDFTIILSFTSNSIKNNSNPPTVIHSMYEKKLNGGWPGFGIDFQGFANGEVALQTRLTGIFSYKKDITNIRVYTAIKRDILNNTFKVYYYNPDTNDFAIKDATSGFLDARFEQNVLLGAYQKVTHEKGRFFTGTIHNCEIYLSSIPDAKIEEMLKGL